METGFNNVSYFSKMFKKKYDLTPKTYRELYKRTINEHVWLIVLLLIFYINN